MLTAHTKQIVNVRCCIQIVLLSFGIFWYALSALVGPNWLPIGPSAEHCVAYLFVFTMFCQHVHGFVYTFASYVLIGPNATLQPRLAKHRLAFLLVFSMISNTFSVLGQPHFPLKGGLCGVVRRNSSIRNSIDTT